MPDRYARALGLLWLAGAGDFEDERRLLPEAADSSEKLVSQSWAEPSIKENLDQARRLSTAIRRFDRAGQRQRAYTELLLIAGEVDSFEAGGPLYPKGKIYAGRALHMIDPHRWAFVSYAGRQIHESLDVQGVRSRYLDWYLRGKWSGEFAGREFSDYSDRRDGVPA